MALGEEGIESVEVAANFLLERNPLCNERFLEERMQQRLKRRLRKAAHLPPPVILRGLLGEEDIKAIFDYIDEVRHGVRHALDNLGEENPEEEEDDDGLEPGSDAWLAEQLRLTAKLSAAYAGNADGAEEEVDPADVLPVDEDAALLRPRELIHRPPKQASWVQCSDNHEKLFLHHGGTMRDGVWRTFADVCPGILVKLLETMHASTLAGTVWRHDPACAQQPILNVRCIEFHHYTPGGALADPGHIDVGSMLTLSVQLSEPAQQLGGRFTTTSANGQVNSHELARGDAALFCSECVHNVTTLTQGSRNSLVIELWTEPPNHIDRHK